MIRFFRCSTRVYYELAQFVDVAAVQTLFTRKFFLPYSGQLVNLFYPLYQC